MITINSSNITYTIAFFIIMYAIICIYIRVNMKFWYSQPVFHIYNIKYWINPVGIINKSPPPINKFVNLINNKLIKVVSDIDITHDGPDNILIKRICDFIKTNYVRAKDSNITVYKPSSDDIIAYLSRNTHSSFFNIYTEKIMLFEKGDLIVPEYEDILGVVSGRILNLNIITPSISDKSIGFQVYYIDNLCVKPTHRKSGIALQMIQTFYYNLSRENTLINIYLFKREGTMSAIVPLVYYDTYCFDITPIILAKGVQKMINLIKIDAKNFHILIDYINLNKKRYKCSILPDVSGLSYLISTSKLSVYVIIDNDVIIALYVFRNIMLQFNGKNVCECITIVSDVEDTILSIGLVNCLLDINKKNSLSFVLFEDTSDCGILIKLLQSNPNVRCIFKSPTAFFLYNYARHSFKNTQIMLIY